jgi:hypothetical protein
MMLTVATVTATATSSRSALGGHFWHVVEALGFLVTSLGGIAIAELMAARQRRTAAGGMSLQRAAVATAGPGAGLATASRVGTVSYPVNSAHEPAQRQTLLPLVALAGAAAAAVHFVVMPEHFEEAALYGTFFAVAASAQILYSLMLLGRPSRPLLVAGALGNFAIVVLWLVTRTAGIPLGPGAGSVESVGGLDVLATGFEVITTLGAVLVLTRSRSLVRALRPTSWSPVIWAFVAFAAAGIAVTTYLSPPS